MWNPFGKKSKSDITGKKLGVYEAFDAQEVIDKTIYCIDNIPRRVVEIVPATWYPDMFIINENDPDSQAGHFVHVLDLARQTKGGPRPTFSEMQAFNNINYPRAKVEEQGAKRYMDHYTPIDLV